MPDGDVFEKHVPHAWKRAYRCLEAGEGPEAVGSRILGALTKTLREAGGVTSLRECGAVIERVRTHHLSPTDALAAARTAFAGSGRLAPIAREVAAQIALETAFGRPAASEGTLAVAEALCRRLVDAKLLDHARAGLAGETRPFATEGVLAAALENVQRVIEPGIRAIAAQLTADPSAARIRAPRRAPRPPVPLSDLLARSILP